MINDEMLGYIRSKLAAGIKRDEITQALVVSGWEQADIDEAFLTIEGALTHRVAAPVTTPAAPAAVMHPAQPTQPIQQAKPIQPITIAEPTHVIQSTAPVLPVKTTPPVEPLPSQIAHPAAPITNVMPAAATAVAPAAANVPVAQPVAQSTPQILQPTVPPAVSLPASPTVTPTMPQASPQETVSKKSVAGFLSKTVLFSVLGVMVALAIAGGAAYAYVQKIGPFAHIPYTQDNLLSGLLASFANINTSSYAFSGTLNVGPRDAGAVPFTVQTSNEAQLREQYQNDSTRLQNVSTLLMELENSKNGYPASLQQLANDIKAKSRYGAKISIQDPVSGSNFSYKVTDGGTDFALTVSFETDAAINAIRKARSYSLSGLHNFAATTTLVEGTTVTFTKNSPAFAYLSPEPPKPYLVSLGESMRMLPAEVQVALSVAASTDWTKENADWKFNTDATANFGDLSFKVDADALKKDTTYYFRINNIPSLFGATLASMKGQWVKIDPSAASTSANGYNEYLSIAKELPSAEKNYKKNREEIAAFLKKIVQDADTEHLFSFKNAPYSDSVDGRQLYRYDLEINKSAIVPFYKKMVDEANVHGTTAYSSLYNDPGTINYLESDEFSQVFDYLNKNTSMTLWVDPKGYPAIVQYTMRVIPPDTATALANKQVNIVFKLVFSGINQSVDISAPSDAKPIEELITSTDANNNYSLDGARTQGRDAKRIADIKTIQLALESYYNDKGSYPTKLSALTPGYLPIQPTDPTTLAAYSYAALGSGAKCSGFHLGATLEATNSALSTDIDASAKSTCTGSAPDFNGKGFSCGSGTGVDLCYDVTN